MATERKQTNTGSGASMNEDGKLMPWTREWLREYARLKKERSERFVLEPIVYKQQIPLFSKKMQWLRRQGHLCCWCGDYCDYRDSTWEHIIPRSRGGSNEDDNLAVAHKKCNHRRESDMTWNPHPAPLFNFVRLKIASYKPPVPSVVSSYKHPASPGIVANEDFWKQQT